MAGVPSTTGAAVCGDDQGATPAGKGKARLSEATVQWILSRERRQFAPDTSDCPPDVADTLRKGTVAFKVLSDSFAEFQDEVRAQYEAKGYVEVDVDEESERMREDELQSMREELADLFDGIDLSGVTFSDRYYDGSEGEGDMCYYNFENDDESESEEEDADELAGAEDAENEDVSPGSKSTQKMV